LGYLLDLHLYLGRRLVPAPQKPDAAAIQAAAASTMAGIGGAAEGKGEGRGGRGGLEEGDRAVLVF
jgi:hypothetical protein